MPEVEYMSAEAMADEKIAIYERAVLILREAIDAMLDVACYSERIPESPPPRTGYQQAIVRMRRTIDKAQEIIWDATHLNVSESFAEALRYRSVVMALAKTNAIEARDEATAKAVTGDFTSANHWNAYASGLEDFAEQLRVGKASSKGLSDMNDRPEWKYKLSEDQVEWLATGIVKITHHSETNSDYTSREWIELHKKERGGLRFPTSFLSQNELFKFEPNWRELVVPTDKGEQALKDLAAIKAWEKENAAERAEFERLKKKFGGASA